MIHPTIGNVGHLAVIISFVTALVSAVAYLKTSLVRPPEAGTAIQLYDDWLRLARWSYYLHGIAILGVVATLLWIVSNHYYEYHYAWSYSSRSLPAKYIISSFWHGQEGSFLLWLFWNVVLGIILIHTSGQRWEGPMMTVFALVQSFLTSMILGIVLVDTFKIGSSPFLLLRDALPDVPIFTSNPNYVPEDGKGMNPLLQNYWMVIHPPTLFLGYATTLVPFAYCVAGLWKNAVSEWIRPALPWALFSAMVLGVGILMGGYWAYETLNFGGYWNWDPVENSVLVPWLTLVAAIHMMLIAKRSSTGLKSAIILSVATFLLILYSTFLTRSGILGNASVHSFTDLGLSGQLLVYMLVFLVLAIVLMVTKWKLIPGDKQETSTYSKEFWLFIGATVLCLSSFQVLATTSIPVYNKLLEAFGVVSTLAMPADQMAHYTKFQLWFFSIIAILTGVGQYIWWQKADKGSFTGLIRPAITTLLISALWIAVGGIQKPTFMVLLTASLFALVANGTILWGIMRGQYRLSGGAITHIGVGLMLIGILFSSGYSKVISKNTSGLILFRDEPAKNNNRENVENTLLWYGKATYMDQYLLTYKGKRVEIRDVPGYVPIDWVQSIDGDFHGIALQDIVQKGRQYYKKGDTLELHPENYYYEVEYREPSGKVFTLYPRAQLNDQMGEGGIVPSPDIQRTLGRDLYTYVQQVQDPTSEDVWSKPETHLVAPKDTFFINDYVAIFDHVVQTREIEGMTLGPNDAAVKAVVRVLDKDREYTLSPMFIIKDRMVGRVPDNSRELGLRLQVNEIDPRRGTFTFAVNTTQRDYIVMKAVEKPLINVLWIGTLIVVIGFSMAAVRRYREFSKMRNKDVSKHVFEA